MLKLTDVSEMCTASITALMMGAVRTSETSVNFNVTTCRYIPKDSKRHARRRENLKSHKIPIKIQFASMSMIFYHTKLKLSKYNGS
jgi:hypothetical protein